MPRLARHANTYLRQRASLSCPSRPPPESLEDAPLTGPFTLEGLDACAYEFQVLQKEPCTVVLKRCLQRCTHRKMAANFVREDPPFEGVKSCCHAITSLPLSPRNSFVQHGVQPELRKMPRNLVSLT